MLTGKLEIRAEHLKVAYGKSIALSVPHIRTQGRVIAVIGHNGSGKSTMLKSLLELLLPREGTIQAAWVDGEDRTILVPEKHMAFSPENGAVFEDLSVESYVKLWCRIKHADGNYYQREGSAILEQLQVPELYRKLGRELSKGQRRRVMAAVGFISKPRLFLFDEPFDGLDILQSNELANIILEQSRKMSVIVSSHRMDVVERIADQVIVLKGGRIHAFGEVDAVCETLCGLSIMITSSDGHTLPYDRVVADLQREFNSCLVHQIGRQVMVTGTDVNLELLRDFFHRSSLEAIRMDTVRPSLVDAMSYHLNRLH